jgi:nicotinic acid mononucleotide adenylyltransferase
MSANMFIGRYQSPHKGHQAIFDTYLKQGEPILIAIRDVKTDEKNPLTSQQVQKLWQTVYQGNPLVEVIIIPDIQSVNYGRGVGYEVKEIQVTQDIANISATDIRNSIQQGLFDWRHNVDESIWTLLESYFLEL